MKVGSPVLLYNGNLVAATSTALGCQTKYTKTVRVPKITVQEAGCIASHVLAVVHYIQDRAGDYGSEGSDAHDHWHDLLFLTDKAAPQDEA